MFSNSFLTIRFQNINTNLLKIAQITYFIFLLFAQKVFEKMIEKIVISPLGKGSATTSTLCITVGKECCTWLNNISIKTGKALP